MVLPTSTLRAMLWFTTLALAITGLAMVASTTTVVGDGEPSHRKVIIQVAALVIGVLAAFGLSGFGLDRLRRSWLVIGIAGLALGLMAITPIIGPTINGAKRWIRCGPINIQSAELAKLALVVVMAWYLAKVQEKVRLTINGALLPMAGFIVLASLVYLTKDLGSVLVMAAICWAMLFFAGANWGFSTVAALGCLPLFLYLSVFETAYRRDRILAFLDPWNTEAGHHLRQSFIAIGSGGWCGVGYGQGACKQNFLPERHTDFIFAVICEELGWRGAMLVASGFLLWVALGLGIAARCQDRFPRLIAIGATVLIGVQAFWNMLVVVGSVPTKGLTLPFISYGGSSMVVCLLAVGLLDAAARKAHEPALEVTPLTTRIGASVVRSRRMTEAS